MHNGTQEPGLIHAATATTGQAAGRRQRRSHQGWVRFMLTLFALMIGVGAGLTLFYFPVLAVSHVEVLGVERSAVRATVDSLALEGSSLLSLPVEDIRGKLLTDPWVRNAVVQRSLPNNIVVYIEERERSVLWQANKETYWVDRDGTVLERAAAIDPKAPLVKDMDGPLRQPGDIVDPDAVQLTLLLTLLVPQEIKEKATAFEYLSYGGLVVETEKGKRARFGDSTDLEWKLATWTAVLKSEVEKKTKVGHIDLRFSDRPFFRQ